MFKLKNTALQSFDPGFHVFIHLSRIPVVEFIFRVVVHFILLREHYIGSGHLAENGPIVSTRTWHESSCYKATFSTNDWWRVLQCSSRTYCTGVPKKYPQLTQGLKVYDGRKYRTRAHCISLPTV